MQYLFLTAKITSYYTRQVQYVYNNYYTLEAMFVKGYNLILPRKKSLNEFKTGLIVGYLRGDPEFDVIFDKHAFPLLNMSGKLDYLPPQADDSKRFNAESTSETECLLLHQPLTIQ